MKYCKRLSAFFFAMLCVSVLSFAADGAKESPGAYVSDAWITTKVKAALVEDKMVKATEVNVETLKGVVQLTGFVSSDAAMQQAVRITRSIKGVTSVNNDMHVK